MGMTALPSMLLPLNASPSAINTMSSTMPLQVTVLKKDFDKVCSIIKSQEQQMADKLKEKDEEIRNLTNQLSESQQNDASLSDEVRSLKSTIRKMEDEENESIKDLGFNPKQVKEFMALVKTFGEDLNALKKRQFELAQSIGTEDKHAFKIRMDALCRDMMQTQTTHGSLFDDQKQFELMTKDKKYIALLEDDKLVQGQNMEEYVRKNQALQSN